MSPELLKLNIAQLERAFEKTRTNRYADTRKIEYHESLVNLFKKILKEDLSKYDYSSQIRLKKVLDFIFYSIEFLDSSTLTNIPYEIIFCLEKALNDWVNTNTFIIVTSLQTNISSYSFNPVLALTPEYYDIIKNDFLIEFKYKLIQINLPRYLVHDYLANVVLYHELGHFIDMKFNISDRIIIAKYGYKPIYPESVIKEYNHLREFFADIFAAQYIGEASNYYLNFVAHNFKDCDTHPGTKERLKTTEDFIFGKYNSKIDELKNATEATTSIILKKRFSSINNKDFIRLIPPIINNDLELHSIYEIGWKLWKEDIIEYKKMLINYLSKYRILNNLIEKSISNYMVFQKWK